VIHVDAWLMLHVFNRSETMPLSYKPLEDRRTLAAKAVGATQQAQIIGAGLLHHKKWTKSTASTSTSRGFPVMTPL